jgi:hypothetical protein
VATTGNDHLRNIWPSAKPSIIINIPMASPKVHLLARGLHLVAARPALMLLAEQAGMCLYPSPSLLGN